MNITLKYSCHRCGLKAVEVSVSAREDEDVLVWMEKIGWNLQEDHLKRSPDCRATSLSEVMIPVSGSQKIGGPTAQ